MDKEPTLAFIKAQLTAGVITTAELQGLVGQTAPAPMATTGSINPVPNKDAGSNVVINALYAIGGVIALAGVGILVAQNWADIGFTGRILVTLGISFAAYVVALLFSKAEHSMLSQVLFTISGVLAPLGAFVLFDEAGLPFDATNQLMIAGALTVIYGVALLTSKKGVPLILTVWFATWAFYAFLFKALDINVLDDLLKWAAMIVGISYLAIGYGSKHFLVTEGELEKSSVQGALYSMGALSILTAGITIGGGFDFIFIGILFAAFYASVFLKSRSILVLAALFLIGHLFNLTAKYFSNSVSWPVALIVVGFLVVAIGYGTFYIGKHYISKK